MPDSSSPATTPSFNVAVVGATGAVGTMMVEILQERKFPVGQLYPLASHRSLGKTLSFRGKELFVSDAEEFDFGNAQIALFSAGSTVSKTLGPKAAAAGCVVIDNSSKFRYEDDVPLVVPEVNPHSLEEYRNRHIIANPNCSTIQLVTALKPLHDAARITRVNIATYQAASGAGARAVTELAEHTAAMLSGQPCEPEVFQVSLAFNCIPHIDAFQDNGYTREEMKILWETRKILGDDAIAVNATAVRVPVFYGHAEAVHLETATRLTAARAREILADAPGICVIDEHAAGGYPTQRLHASGNDEVFVGRIREDISHSHGLNLWIVSDNIRKGAALNAVQIAEHLVIEWLK